MPGESCRDRLELALFHIEAPGGEGARACLTVYADAARAAADAADARARAGVGLGSLDGVIVSVKDLFDVAGEVTRAGSRVLFAEGNAAPADAPVVRRLRQAGAVIVAKTNMTEFAFSGVGTNPHFGTPGNPADRARIPGGSSSGAAVAVADGMCDIAIGTDTGGSTRIPAALCGLVGFKPSRQRVPTEGVFALSWSLDSVGPIGRNVADCVAADAVLAGEDLQPHLHPIMSPPLTGLRFGIAQGLPLQSLDATVGKSFAAALDRLEAAGVRLSHESIALFDDMLAANAQGGIATAEAFALHRARLATHGAEIDPNVRARIERGAAISAADHIDTVRARTRLIALMDARLADLDALIMPTTPIAAPLLAEVAEPRDFSLRNMLLLRNTAIWNFFDVTAISLPLPRAGGLPTGLMLVARNGSDRRLFAMAAAVERVMQAS